MQESLSEVANSIIADHEEAPLLSERTKIMLFHSDWSIPCVGVPTKIHFRILVG